MGKSVERPRVVWTLTEEQRLANHIPPEVWKLSRTCDVFIEDGVTGELIEVIDLSGLRGEKHEQFRTITLSQRI